MKPIYFPEKVLFAEGGYLCDKCGKVEIGLNDLRGYYVGTVFHVRGYQCPSCGYLSCNTSIKSGNLPFDWRKMPVSRVPARLFANQEFV